MIAKILIKAQFFEPLPLATEYVAALYTLMKTSNFEIHSWFHCQDIRSQILQIPIHFQWRGAHLTPS